ncbi:MAG TPA: hypothetical protein VLC06_00175, partial [Polyangia bacterium]|nr:hypothetical protein [Polyangia bacterium]
MQLRRPTRLILAATVVAGLAAPARADDPTEASARLTFFREPATDNKGITVIHPQVDAASPLGGGLGIAAGWEADAVSGATPALFVDTVTK